MFEILLKWVETRDWEEAFNSVIPKRKFQGGGKGRLDDTSTSGQIDDGGGDPIEGSKLDDAGGKPTALVEAGQDVPGDGDK